MGNKGDPERARAYQAEYRRTHQEERSAYAKAYRQKNGERLRALDRQRAKDDATAAAERARTWYNNNKERAAASRKAWYEKNKEAALAYGKRYRAENAVDLRSYDRERAKTEKRQELQRRIARENSAKKVEAVRAWAAANPDKAKRNRKNVEGRRRARLRSQPFEPIDLLDVYRSNDGLCGICNKPVAEDAFELDHIVPISKGGGHVRENVQPAHRSCNRRKGARTDVEIYSL